MGTCSEKKPDQLSHCLAHEIVLWSVNNWDGSPTHRPEMRSPVIRLFGYGGNPPIIDIVIKIEATNLSAQCRQHAGAPSSSCSSWSATVMMMMMMRIIVIAGVSMGLAACSSSCGPKKERRTGYAHLKALGRPLAPLTFRRRCKPRHRSPGFFPELLWMWLWLSSMAGKNCKPSLFYC